MQPRIAEGAAHSCSATMEARHWRIATQCEGMRRCIACGAKNVAHSMLRGAYCVERVAKCTLPGAHCAFDIAHRTWPHVSPTMMRPSRSFRSSMSIARQMIVITWEQTPTQTNKHTNKQMNKETKRKGVIP